MKHLSLVLSPLHVEESLRLFSVWLQMSLHCHDFACGYPFLALICALGSPLSIHDSD